MDRYFHAFETNTMPEDTCAPRITALAEQIKALEARAAELIAQQDDDQEQAERTTAADIDKLRHELRAALRNATPNQAKPILQTMIENIRVDARDHIEPTFRIPAVRVDYGYMEGSAWEGSA